MNKPYNKVFVSQLANKNQFLIKYTNAKDIALTFWAFQSYSTLIAMYNPNTKELLINWSMWDYSKTTLKHLKIFINEYTCYAYENKQQFLKEILKNDNIKTFNE